MMTKEDFQNYAKAGFNIIPVAKEIFLEDQTPLTLYSQISNKSNSFLNLNKAASGRFSLSTLSH